MLVVRATEQNLSLNARLTVWVACLISLLLALARRPERSRMDKHEEELFGEVRSLFKHKPKYEDVEDTHDPNSLINTPDIASCELCFRQAEVQYYRSVQGEFHYTYRCPEHPVKNPSEWEVEYL